MAIIIPGDDFASDKSTTGRLTVGQAVSGSIDASWDADWFKVKLEAGVIYRFYINPASAADFTAYNTGPGFSLYEYPLDPTPVSGKFWYNLYPASGFNAIEFKPVMSGDYYLAVSGSYMGKYTVTSERVVQDDFPDEIGSAAPIALDQAVNGRLDAGTDRDFFAVTLEKGKLYTFEGSSATSLAVGVYLPDPVMGQVSVGTGQYSNATSITPTQTGTYYIGVNSPMHVPGAYTLRATITSDDHGNAADTATRLALGTPVTGKLDAASDHDWFKVTMAGGTAYSFMVNLAGQEYLNYSIVDSSGKNHYFHAPGVYRYDSKGTMTGYGNIGSWRAPADGDYYFVIGGYGNTNKNTYSVSAAPIRADDVGGDIASAGLISGAGRTRGHINEVGDKDWYRVPMQAGHAYTFDLSQVVLADGTPVNEQNFTLVNSKGETVAGSYRWGDFASQRILYQPKEGGDYYLAFNSSYSASGDYKIRTTVTAADTIAGDTSTTAVIRPGELLTGRADFMGDTDWYRVELVAGKTYGVRIATMGQGAAAQGGGASLQLMDANGRVLRYDLLEGWSGMQGDRVGSIYVQESGTFYLAAAGIPGSEFRIGFSEGAVPVPAVPMYPGIKPLSDFSRQLDIVLEFEDNVSVVGGVVEIRKLTGELVGKFDLLGNPRVEVFYRQLSLTPDWVWERGVHYMLTLPAGAVKDEQGNLNPFTVNLPFTSVNSTLRLAGTDGNDIFHNGTRSDTINGGAGMDTVVFNGRRDHYEVSVQQDGTVTVRDVYNEWGVDTLTSIERLQFYDATVAVGDGNSIPAVLFRLYRAAFDRKPDIGGLGFWIAQAEKGTSMQSIASAFIGSAEFTGMYGAQSSNRDFVETLYEHVLHRQAADREVDFWASALDLGLYSREQTLIDFSNSQENAGSVQLLAQITYLPFG